MRLEMLQVARLAPNLLHDARDLVADYVASQLHPDGGFIDRAGEPDLYYTVFGLECLLALREDVPRAAMAAYLHQFGDGAACDFVHLGCLARCWAALADFERLGVAASDPPPSQGGARGGSSAESSLTDQANKEDAEKSGRAPGTGATGGSPASAFADKSSTNNQENKAAVVQPNVKENRTGKGESQRTGTGGLAASGTRTSLSLATDTRKALAAHLESYRTADGGYAQDRNEKHGTVYGCFLALATYQDLRLPLPDADAMITCIESQRAADGGYANGRDFPIGTTPTTAAAVTALRVLGAPLDRKTGRWLLAQCHPTGGFLAMPDAPMPDLLSTAVALHALSGLHVSVEPIKEKTLDFIDSLWVNKGSFYGNFSEDMLDVEYTFYGLLALGHLSL